MKVLILLLVVSVAAVAQTTLVDLRTQSKGVDFSNATLTKPARVGAALPPTCSTGEAFFNTSAAAGFNLYICSTTNLWQALGAGSGGGAATSVMTSTVSTLPSTCSVGDVRFAIDASLAGGGFHTYWCTAANTWTQFGYVGGGSGALSSNCSSLPCTIDITAAVPLKAGVNAWTGANDFSAASKLTFRVVTSDPATCDATTREIIFNSTSNLLKSCNATNVWSSITGGAGGVTSITGTGNQIAASASTGAVTLSIPTNPTLPGITSGTFSGPLTGNVTGDVSGSAATANAGDSATAFFSSGTLENALLDNDLTALGDNATNGIWTRTGAGTGAARTITGTTNRIVLTNGDGVSGNPTIDIGSAVPICTKYTVVYTSVQTAATTNDVTLFTLPARGKITGLTIKHSTAFAGTSITAVTVGVGLSGNTTAYAPAFNIFQAVGNTVMQDDGGHYSADFTSHAVTARFTSTGANLSSLNAGSVDIWACTATLP